ncbi:Ca-activated chloride channel family protein [Povalibacter uvarum]|uniref:Ca-activated chloride channel family protein n=1 Tax=Povalibacter uvarum TaxID=732238 RepID=A0A841HQ87_9GAMM|nr:VWA domain-containing protein [Povalibacter uvarum]MBB6094804.1 Ca-activated chloride channel family protein [Povalibacter uvarum]
MKVFAHKCTIVTATALLSACAAQRDGEREAQVQKPAEAAEANVVVLSNPITPPPVAIDIPAPSNAPVAQAEATAAIRTEVAYDQARKMSFAPIMAPPPFAQPANTEQYEHHSDNPVHRAAEQPVSTFSIDVDTGAYANVRRFLNDGQMPPQDAVRVEEMINYFDYQYSPPDSRATPFKVATELTHAPWNDQAWLLRIGIKGFEVSASERPPANLVFLIDVSGSMQSPDKLPLLKNAFRLLTDQLTARDRVSMVVYAGSSGVVLEPTPGDQKHKIREAIDRLEAGGSTNGAEGIERAYQLAKSAHVAKGINRVVLATDGDFNVGVVDFEALVDMAERQRASGVALTTLGFGTGNYNDKLLERLADAGNGNYSYVDSLSEARKVLVSELSSTLFTIAKDVKIQVEFNPAEVAEYRLIGYENRMLAREDFNNDKVDAGDIGAGHRITALYEIVPAGAKGRVDDLRYAPAATKPTAGRGEIANVRLRYKLPDGETSKLLEYPIARASLVAADRMSPDLRFAASVAAFGQVLRGGKYTGEFGYRDIESLAKAGLGDDPEGYRREFVSLVKLAQALTPGEATQKVGQVNR